MKIHWSGAFMNIPLPAQYLPYGHHDTEPVSFTAEYHKTLRVQVIIAHGKKTSGPMRLTRVPVVEEGEPRTPLTGFCLRIGHLCLIAHLVYGGFYDPVRVRADRYEEVGQ